jgi:hypothetical protein
MALESPRDLIDFANRLGLDIGKETDSPVSLVDRLLAYADGFVEGESN